TDESVTSPTDYIDPRTGVKVLREAGYVDQALVLAKRQKMYDLCLDILINDKQDYNESLAYLGLMEKDT
uniref:Uncharacterized protein n=1 Tax=Romanomermis culicivorax TaxID=13658 RepID=A0A915INM9_ROMCU